MANDFKDDPSAKGSSPSQQLSQGINAFIAELGRAWRELSPYAAQIWLFYYLSIIISLGLSLTIVGALVALVPVAGFLIVLHKLKTAKKTPDFNDLVGQFDHLLPLLILSILYFMSILVFLIVRTILVRLPLLGPFFNLFIFLVFFSTIIPLVSYAILLICDQRDSAVDAVLKALKLFMNDFGRQFLLGLALLLLMSLTCGLAAPLGFYLLIEQYGRHFPRVTN